MTCNIYNTKIYVYKGVDYNPDGSPVPFSWATAWFPPEDEGGYLFGGEYMFDVDEDDILYPTGTVGNAAYCDECVEYENYCDMIIHEMGYNCA